MKRSIMPPADLVCSVCSTSLETIGILHYHQMCHHTTEELSLALISVKGLSLAIDDDMDCESMLLRNGLEKYPQFLQNTETETKEDSDQENSRPNSRLKGSIKTLDGKTVDTPCIEISKIRKRKSADSTTTAKKTVDDNEDPLVISTQCDSSEQTSKKTNSGKNISLSKKVGNSVNKVKRKRTHAGPKSCNKNDGSKKPFQNLLMTCSSEEFGISGKEDSDVEDVNVVCLPGESHDTSGDEGGGENDVSSTSNQANACNNKSKPSNVAGSETVESGADCLEFTCEEAAMLQDGTKLQIEIINVPSFDDIASLPDSEQEKNSQDQDSKSGELVASQNKCESQSAVTGNSDEGEEDTPKSVVTSSSIDSILSPLNSLHPENHIEAIITSLPNILKPLDKKTGKGSKNNFVLPSPLTDHHKDSIVYDYGAIQVKEEIGSDIEETIEIEECGDYDDYFIPRIEMSQDDNKDAWCETSPLVSSEKEVQAHSSIDRADSGIQTDVNADPKKKSPMKLRAQRNNLFAYHWANAAALLNKRMKKNAKRKRKTKKRPSISQNRSVASSNLVSSRYSASKSPASVLHNMVLDTTKKKKADTAAVKRIRAEALRYQTNANKSSSFKALQHSLFGLHGLDTTTDRRFFCNECGNGYKKKSHLERHLRVHTGERPYGCDWCEKRFAVRSVLKQHIRIHTGEKPYSCSVCFQRFPQKSGLMTHMMLHTGKPFRCDQCEKAFVSNHKLMNHLRCHEGSRPYMCKVCPTSFFTEGALEDHAKIHNKDKTFQCQMCQATFLHEVYLKVHLDEHLEKLLLVEKMLNDQGVPDKVLTEQEISDLVVNDTTDNDI